MMIGGVVVVAGGSGGVVGGFVGGTVGRVVVGVGVGVAGRVVRVGVVAGGVVGRVVGRVVVGAGSSGVVGSTGSTVGCGTVVVGVTGAELGVGDGVTTLGRSDGSGWSLGDGLGEPAGGSTLTPSPQLRSVPTGWLGVPVT
jgi:hypothetical protein